MTNVEIAKVLDTILKTLEEAHASVIYEDHMSASAQITIAEKAIAELKGELERADD